MQPWLKNFHIPTNFEFPVTEITSLENFHEDFRPGVWKAAVALTEPGTLNIAAFDSTSCGVVANNRHHNTRYGSVFFGHTHSGINQFRSSSQYAIAGAHFTEVDLSTFDINEQLSLIETNSITSGSFQLPKLNQCVFNVIDPSDTTIDDPELPGQLQIQSLDAGDISITGSGQLIQIEKRQFNDFISYSSGLLDGNLYGSKEVYTVEGSGGPDVSSFQVSLAASPKWNLQSPSLEATAINTDQDLQLIWDGNGGLGEVLVSLSGIGNPGVYLIQCLFADDGNGSIESGLLKQLKENLNENTSGGITIPSKAGLVLSGRSNYEFFNTADNDLDFGIFLITSHVSAFYDLQ